LFTAPPQHDDMKKRDSLRCARNVQPISIHFMRIELKHKPTAVLISTFISFLLATVLAGVNCGVALAHPGSEDGAYRVRGVVQDQTGAAITHAVVKFRGPGFSQSTSTQNDGGFAFEALNVTHGFLTVTAPGFAPAHLQWSSSSAAAAPLIIVLTPAAVSESMTVTASRTPTGLTETAASVIVLPSETISSTAALTLDDLLRQVPGFTLFRRAGSRAANPTTQGVSLRGVGASGASRALVLADRFPLDDPFGGWIYWDRIPRASVSRIEVVRGAASDLYGTNAMGGVVNIISKKSDAPEFSLEGSFGNEHTPDVSTWSAIQMGRWRAAFAGEAMQTDGYVLVGQSDRGSVDTPAGSEHETANLRLEREVSSGGRIFAEVTGFRETRANGTPLQQNRTHVRQLAFGADVQTESAGSFSLRAYGGPQLFDQTFSSIAPDRDVESLTRLQRVPAQQAGLDLQWSRPVGARQTMVAGVEGREVRGASDELGFFGGAATSATGTGGRQRTKAVFGEDIIRLTPRWIATVGARFDNWMNYDGLATSRPLSSPGQNAVTHFPLRTEFAFSPRLSTLFRVNENLALSGSIYRAFRAPTLNELYRNFRVGNIVTLANSDLDAERLSGAEAGAQIGNSTSRVTLRGTVFWSDTTRSIANVTLNVQPNLITRQRENLGRTRSRGFDLDSTARITPTVDLSAGYEFVDSTVVSFPLDPSLDGLRIPQIPRQALTFQARYANPASAVRLKRWIVAFQGRVIGTQFDDDQNRLLLGSFFSLDAFVSRPLGHDIEVFVAAENLLNDRYAVGRTPVVTLGPPLLFRGGIRIHLGSR
jgi:outer membrane receptor protein involved in Fe transport